MFHCLYSPHLLDPFLCDGHLGSFHVLAVVHSAAVDVEVHVSFQTMFFSEYIIFLVAQMVKSLPAVQETWVLCLGWEGPLEKGMATHSSIPAWRIPWTEEVGGPQSMRSQSWT